MKKWTLFSRNSSGMSDRAPSRCFLRCFALLIVIIWLSNLTVKLSDMKYQRLKNRITMRRKRKKRLTAPVFRWCERRELNPCDLAFQCRFMLHCVVFRVIIQHEEPIFSVRRAPHPDARGPSPFICVPICDRSPQAPLHIRPSSRRIRLNPDSIRNIRR